MPPADQIMRPNARFVQPSDPLAHAVELMRLLGVRELPVVEHGRVVGIVARRDLEPYVGYLEWTPVRTAMTSDPITVSTDVPASDVAQILVSRHLNAVPVVSAGSLIGMISRHDLLRLLIPSE